MDSLVLVLVALATSQVDGTQVPRAVIPPADAQPAAPRELKTQAPLVPIERHAERTRAADLLVGALVMPEGVGVGGKPITLLEAVSRTSDRATQQTIAQMYWKLTAALAEYHFAWDEYEQFERLMPAADKDAAAAAGGAAVAAAPQATSIERHMVASRLATAGARRHDAQQAIVDAQYRLAVALGQAPVGAQSSGTMPLPANLPHLGPYRTSFNEIYSGRPAPPRVVILNESLGARHELIDARGRAVDAALDALDALERAYYRGETPLPEVLAAADHLNRERRKFVEAVLGYNEDIAEYAMSIPVPMVTNEQLVSMLIHPATAQTSPIVRAGGAESSTNTGGVVPAGFDEPTPASPPAGNTAPPANPAAGAAPTGAAPSGAAPATATPGGGTSSGAPAVIPMAPIESPPQTPPLATPQNPAAAGATSEAAPAATQPGTPPAGQRAPGAGDVRPIQTPPIDRGQPQTREALRLANTAAPLYPALVDEPAETHAEHLADFVYWDHADAAGAQALSLAECLRVAPNVPRRDLLDAYWNASHQAAVYRALLQHDDQLDALAVPVAESHSQPNGAEAMLVLQSARTASQARLVEARQANALAQRELARLIGRGIAPAGLQLTTIPLVRGYRAKFDQLRPELQGNADVARLAQSLPLGHAALAERASAVVEADAAIVEGVGAGNDTAAHVRSITSAIDQRTVATLAFLEAVRAYNRQTADYALTVISPQAANEVILTALVGRATDDAS